MIVAIVPARGGSKGIPRKNITLCANKPLISWTIQSALESKLLDKIYVSTEDREIARISRKYGAEVLKRPEHLATDDSLIVETLKYHLENDIQNTKTLVMLQPTSPIREPDLIDFCIEKYKTSDCDSLATGFDLRFVPYGTTTMRRQDMKLPFSDDGSVYVYNPRIILQGKLFTENRFCVCTTREQNIEIDDEFDLWLCEQVLLKRMKDAQNNENIGSDNR